MTSTAVRFIFPPQSVQAYCLLSNSELLAINSVPSSTYLTDILKWSQSQNHTGSLHRTQGECINHEYRGCTPERHADTVHALALAIASICAVPRLARSSCVAPGPTTLLLLAYSITPFPTSNFYAPF